MASPLSPDAAASAAAQEQDQLHQAEPRQRLPFDSRNMGGVYDDVEWMTGIPHSFL
jgi:hypothetical protein